MSQSDTPTSCPEGHDDAVRLLSVFASVGAASPGAAPSAPCGSACACMPG